MAINSVRDALVSRITHSSRGSVSVKVKTLVSEFGFAAKARVRQASLNDVLQQLTDWNIAFRFPAGTSANDYVTLSLMEPAAAKAEDIASQSGTLPAKSTPIEPGRDHKVLSIKGPWAWSIMHADKDVENRDWTTEHRGPLLIHASMTPLSAADEEAARLDIASITGRPLSSLPTHFPTAQILGFVDVIDIVRNSRSPWAGNSDYHWILRNPQPLSQPISGIKGKLRLWTWNPND